MYILWQRRSNLLGISWTYCNSNILISYCEICEGASWFVLTSKTTFGLIQTCDTRLWSAVIIYMCKWPFLYILNWVGKLFMAVDQCWTIIPWFYQQFVDAPALRRCVCDALAFPTIQQIPHGVWFSIRTIPQWSMTVNGWGWFAASQHTNRVQWQFMYIPPAWDHACGRCNVQWSVSLARHALKNWTN